MDFTAAELSRLVAGFMWPFMRIGAMLIAAPVFGAQNIIPTRIRIGLAVLLTITVMPMLPAPPAVAPLSAAGLLISAQQLLIGFTAGFIMQLAFSALVIGGHSVAMSMGLGFASFIDPQNGIQVPVVSKFYVIIGTLLFLVINGHLVMLQVLFASFESLPVGAELLGRDSFLTLTLWGSRMFVGALLIALPALVTIMLINFTFGIMTRAAPTMNIFAVGFPTTMAAGFVIMLITLPNLLPRFTDLVMDGFRLMQTILGVG
jgi:flagellar biosynthetic protein FliR